MLPFLMLQIYKNKRIGNSYKVQIAYTSTAENTDGTTTPGVYSTVGIIKYTNKPELKIEHTNNFLISNF